MAEARQHMAPPLPQNEHARLEPFGMQAQAQDVHVPVQ